MHSKNVESVGSDPLIALYSAAEAVVAWRLSNARVSASGTTVYSASFRRYMIIQLITERFIVSLGHERQGCGGNNATGLGDALASAHFCLESPRAF
jgi:hypothetical protein